MISQAANRKKLGARGVFIFFPVIGFDFDTVSIRRQKFCRRYFFARTAHYIY